MNKDPYARIMEALAEPKTSQQVAGALRMKTGGHVAMLARLLIIGAITRIKPHNSRVYVYSRVWDDVTREKVSELIKENKAHENVSSPYARVVSFDSLEMQKKLQENSKLSRKKRGKIYVAAHWPMND